MDSELFIWKIEAFFDVICWLKVFISTIDHFYVFLGLLMPFVVPLFLQISFFENEYLINRAY